MAAARSGDRDADPCARARVSRPGRPGRAAGGRAGRQVPAGDRAWSRGSGHGCAVWAAASPACDRTVPGTLPLPDTGRSGVAFGRTAPSGRRAPFSECATGERCNEALQGRPRSRSCCVSLSALAAEFPAPKPGEWTVRDFKFHTGEVMPELRIGYTTVGEPTGEPVVVLHGTTGVAGSMLTPNFAGELFGAGQPLDAKKYFIIIPDSIGHGKSSKPSDGLRAKFPQIQLRRHGRGAVSAGQGAPEDRPRAPRDRQLDGRHACLALGAEVSGLHGRGRADGLAADRDGEPQLDDAAAC